jgi:phosphoglycolate phosphatase
LICDLLICDLDGTLIDSREDIADSINLALRDLGLPAHSTEAVTGMIGGGLAALVRRALDPNAHDRSDQVLNRYRAHYGERLLIKTRLYTGVEAILRQARLGGVTLAVATNKPEDFTREILHRLGILDLFEVISGERAGQPRKPDPACVLEILSATRTIAARTLYLGDSRIDLETARAAGVPVALVSWGYTPRPALQAAGPDYLLDAPWELRRLVVPPSGEREPLA